MTKRHGYDDMEVLTVDFYPRTVPSIYAPNTVFTVSKVILNSNNAAPGDSGLLEASWVKSMTNIVGYRITQASVSRPAFAGDTNYQYFMEINMTFTFPNEGRFNSQCRPIACSFMVDPDPASTRTVYQAANDEGSWFRFKHFQDIDTLAVRLIGGNGSRISLSPGATWAVEVEFLHVVCKSAENSEL